MYASLQRQTHKCTVWLPAFGATAATTEQEERLPPEPTRYRDEIEERNKKTVTITTAQLKYLFDLEIVYYNFDMEEKCQRH